MPPSLPKGNGLLGRADSKNPATTCRGITSTGKQCRRDIAAVKPSKSGVLAVTHFDNHETAATYYCWQHKDQVKTLKGSTAAAPGGNAHIQQTHIVPVQQRNSVDSLIDRLGILDINHGSTKPGQGPPDGRIQRPPSWNHADGLAPSGTYRLPVQKREPGFWASLCCLCISSDDDDDRYEIVRHRPQNNGSAGGRPPEMSQSAVRPPQAGMPPTAAARLGESPTERLLRHMPKKTQDPHAFSKLLCEASKPISPKDEPGFIYIFCLTESTRRSTAPSESMFKSRNATGGNASKGPPLLLKIGRTNNVQRRMKEWDAQCGKTPVLVRFYPHVKSLSTPLTKALIPPKGDDSDPAGVRKVPHVGRVERLIHLELADKRVPRSCDVCKREHIEWFEVEASREGVEEIDEVVKRWVRWAEELDV